MNDTTPSEVDTITAYGKDFQTKAISGIISDRAFLERIYDILNPDFFDQDSQKWIIKKTIDYFLKYKQLPTLTYFGTECKQLSIPVLETAIQSQLQSAFSQVKASDLSYIKEQFLEFCKHQKIKTAICDSVDLLKCKNFDAIKSKFDEALKAGLDRDIGDNYIDSVEIRYSECVRDIIKTNLPLLDSLLDGGLGKGELGFFCGNPGGGKSWLIQGIGAEALLQGKNVMHFTMELNAKYTEFRYDSYLTGIGFQDIKNHKDKIKSKIEGLKLNGIGKLYVKYFPLKTISAETLKSFTEHVQLVTGEKIDLMIVDYADLLKPLLANKNGNSYSDAGAVYEELRAVAGILQIPIWTASQANRASSQNDIIEGDDVSESYKKLMTGDFVASMARTTENKNTSTARIHVIKNRFGKDGCTYLCNFNADCGKLEMFDSTSVEGLEILRKIKGQEESTKDVIRKKWKQTHGE